MKTTVLFIATAILSLNGFSQTWNEIIKTVASDRGAYDGFGESVSIDGNRAIVGAQGEDEDASGSNTLNNAGAVYIFELSGGVWVETAKLVASDRAEEDIFGHSVSISGDKAIVGAYKEDEDASNSNTLSRAGSAYIFELNGGVWTETAKLVASDRDANDEFGYSVSISNNIAIVGARWEDEDAAGANTANQAGSAYVFELNGGVWTETAKLVASDRDGNDEFGYSVSLDGSKAIVGAYNENEDVTGANTLAGSGSAYIFELSNGMWSETTKIVASDRAAYDQFGYSVSINSDKVVVGALSESEDATGGNTLTAAGSAYVFEFNGGTWTETQKLVASDREAYDEFAISVCISGDKIIAGASGEGPGSGPGSLEDAGAAYIFEFDGTDWTETSKLIANDRLGDDFFGSSVSISGQTVIVGAKGEDEDATNANTLDYAGSAFIYGSCTLPTNNVTTSGTTLTADETGVDYQWLDCNNGYIPISGATSQSYTATSNGNYAVEVSQNGCADTSDCVAITTVGLDDLKNTYGVHVYPNPASDIINIQSSQKIETVRLLDINGQLIKQTDAKSIAVRELNPGVYLVQITTSNGVVTKRIVKQ